MPQEWWVPGRDIQAHPDWSNAAPCTSRNFKRFANGRALIESDVAVLRGLLRKDARQWLHMAVECVQRGEDLPEPPVSTTADQRR